MRGAPAMGRHHQHEVALHYCPDEAAFLLGAGSGPQRALLAAGGALRRFEGDGPREALSAIHARGREVASAAPERAAQMRQLPPCAAACISAAERSVRARSAPACCAWAMATDAA